MEIRNPTPKELEKRRLRRYFRRMRAELSPADAAEKSRAIIRQLLALPDFHAAAGVFVYVSMPGEPETRGLIETLLARPGKRVYVPRCGDAGRMDAVRIFELGDLFPGHYGIWEPDPALPPCGPGQIDFCVLPALACGTDGARLGQGGGYYDRFMAGYSGPHAVICFEAFICEGIPTEAYDRRVGRIVTEKRVITTEWGKHGAQ